MASKKVGLKAWRLAADSAVQLVGQWVEEWVEMKAAQKADRWVD